MNRMRFDMGYVLLSFVDSKGQGSPRWRKWQGYSRKNLAKVVFDECEKKGISIFAITSAYLGLPTGPHDRFKVLQDEAQQIKSLRYDDRNFGGNSFVIQKEGKKVYILRSQLVCANFEGKRTDFCTVGTSYVDCTGSKPGFAETAKSCGESGIVLTKPRGACGLPLTDTKKYTGLFHGVLLAAEDGMVANATDRAEIERLNQEGAKLNLVTISGCHLPQGIGLGHTYVDVDISNENNLLQSLKDGFCQNTTTSLKNPGIIYQAKWKIPLGIEIKLAGLRKK